MTATQQPTFDYGEPWGFDGENWITDARNKEILNLDSIHSRNAKRLIACVNACQKMADPAAEIQVLRDAASCLSRLADHGHAEDCLFLNRANALCDCGVDQAQAALAKLQTFITA